MLFSHVSCSFGRLDFLVFFFFSDNFLTTRLVVLLFGALIR